MIFVHCPVRIQPIYDCDWLAPYEQPRHDDAWLLLISNSTAWDGSYFAITDHNTVKVCRRAWQPIIYHPTYKIPTIQFMASQERIWVDHKFELKSKQWAEIQRAIAEWLGSPGL